MLTGIPAGLKVLLSAFIAGMICSLTAYLSAPAGQVHWTPLVVGGLVVFLKDIQSTLTTSPSKGVNGQ